MCILFTFSHSANVWFFQGLEYPAVVEFAPFQKISKKKLKKKDAKAGSIEDGKLIFMAKTFS